MASFLTDLAKPYVEKLINGAIAESSYICCFTCIAKDFEEARASLERERSTVKENVDQAIRRGDYVQVNVRSWEKDADKLIQEDTKTKQKCLFGFCPHIIWRYKRGKELTYKREQIKRLIETGKQLSIGLPAHLPDVERYSSRDYISFESRKSKYKELFDALKDDNNYITGLQGMGGTGKTTMAKEVGKELKQSKQFTYVIDTTVSLSPDIRKIQDDIAGPLGLKFDDCSESDRPKKLWSRLTNEGKIDQNEEKKILLILDDVWDVIDFDKIGIPDNHKDCRILVTTRNLFVCNRLGCNKTIQLTVLSDEEAWTMFQRHAGLNEMSPTSLLDKGRKIANECKGLPIAIAVIASSLKGIQHPEEWDGALKSLQKPMHGVDDELVEIYKRLQVSYDNMKNEKAKRLFLLCSVFREDEKIPTERLTRLGIGGGLFGEDYGSYEDARTQVVRSKNKLLDSCLFLEADQNRVKMHDLVRDAAQWIANKEIQTVKLYDKNQKTMVEREANIKYLLCEGKLKDVFSFKLDGSKLKILIVNVHEDEDCHDVKIEVLNSFFENITGLRVFHLFHDHYSKLALSLPHSIHSLKNIRSLLFTRVNLGDISILGNLRSLETLDLEGCKIDELPHELQKVEKFRLLNLECCEIARNNPFEVIKGCSSLEELYFSDSFNDFCREITFPKLQRFYINDATRPVNELSSKFVSLGPRDGVFLSETTLKYCMQEAEVLRLARIQGGCINIIPEIVPMDHGMNDLEDLSLSFISQLHCLIDTKHIVSKVFSKLVVLKLEGMDNLEELFNGPLSFDSLNNLEELSIKDCKHLKSLFKCKLNLFNLKSVSLEGCPVLIFLFQLPTARSLVLLETLKITDCELLENIIMDDKKGEESISEIVADNNITSHGSMFHKLKVLIIERCPRIELIPSFLSAHDLPTLESITIRSCDKLEYIFGQDVKLGSLKIMVLSGIPNFIDIFPECNRTMTSPIQRSSSISGDASKPQEAQSEPIKCNIFSWTDIYCCGKKYGHNKLRSTKVPLVSEEQPQDNLMESNSYPLNIWESAHCLSTQSHILCNVKEIYLCNVSKMKSLFNLSTAPRMLLETLHIWNCNEWRHIITIDIGGDNWGTVFPKLRKVKVEYCEQLEYIIGHDTDDHQNHTEIHLHFPALEDLCLWNLPSLVGMCPKQYRTTFPHLKDIVLHQCSQFAIKSIGDFLTHHSVTRFVDGTIIKELSENVEHFIALKTLWVDNSKIESIFCLNEISKQQLNLACEYIDLNVLPMMTCLFVGPKNSISLQKLTKLKIWRCEKLKIVFSPSIIRCLPHLLVMRIEGCKELKNIIEDDLENTTKTCFPNLKTLVVVKCNKLKYVFPISMCKELPGLNVLIIREAEELEEIFLSEGDNQKVEIPNLKAVIFENLPILSHDQGIQFQDVKHRFIKNCEKLSLASATTADFEKDLSEFYFYIGRDFFGNVIKPFRQLRDESKGHDTCNEYASSILTANLASGHKFTSSQKEMEQKLETKHEFVENVPQQEMPSVAIIPTNSKELMNEQEMEQQRLLGETDATVKPSQENNVSEISFEEGTTSANAKTKTSSQEEGDSQRAIASTPIAITKPVTSKDDQVSLNDDNVRKVSSNTEDQFSKDDDILVSKSRPSSIASQFPSKPSEGDPSQIDEDLSSSLVVTGELESLVSKKHLAIENLSLLTDFLVKHPSVLIRDTSLSSRYKGYAYNCLAELLKFLQTHCVLDVLGSSNSEFVELLQDVRRFPFDKEWLDGVEKRALFPGLQFSQNALEKLLDSQRHVTKEVEDIRLKINIFNQHVEDLKHQLTSSEADLESIIQQKAKFLETKAALTAPLGY